MPNTFNSPTHTIAIYSHSKANTISVGKWIDVSNFATKGGISITSSGTGNATVKLEVTQDLNNSTAACDISGGGYTTFPQFVKVPDEAMFVRTNITACDSTLFIDSIVGRGFDGFGQAISASYPFNVSNNQQ